MKFSNKNTTFKRSIGDAISFSLLIIIAILVLFLTVIKITQHRSYSAKIDVEKRLEESRISSETNLKPSYQNFITPEEIDQKFVSLYSEGYYEEAQLVAEIGSTLKDVSLEFVLVQWLRVYDCQLAIELNRIESGNETTIIEAYENIDSVFQEILFLTETKEFEDILRKNKYCNHLVEIAEKYYKNTYGEDYKEKLHI